MDQKPGALKGASHGSNKVHSIGGGHVLFKLGPCNNVADWRKLCYGRVEFSCATKKWLQVSLSFAVLRNAMFKFDVTFKTFKVATRALMGTLQKSAF